MLVLNAQRFGAPGYGIAKSIQQISEDVLKVEEGRCTRASAILKKGWSRRMGPGWPSGASDLHSLAKAVSSSDAELSEYRRVSQASDGDRARMKGQRS